jgi:hypothetical protein
MAVLEEEHGWEGKVFGKRVRENACRIRVGGLR